MLEVVVVDFSIMYANVRVFVFFVAADSFMISLIVALCCGHIPKSDGK